MKTNNKASSFRKAGSSLIALPTSDARNQPENPHHLQNCRTSLLYSPIEAHWQLPHHMEKTSSMSRLMSFKSIQDALRKIGRSNTLRSTVQGTHDPKYEHIVQALRELLMAEGCLPEIHDDYHTLLRFLRMRSFNITKAKDAFLNMLRWREDADVDAIAKDFQFEEIEKVKKYYPHGFHGVDRYGRPLYIERIGMVDLNKLFSITSIERYMKYHISEQEKTMNLRYPACSLAVKKHIASTTSILDVKGVGISNFSKPARELFIEIQKIDSNYYPETLHKLFIVNAGTGFLALWKVLKAFLEARTLAKIHVLGSKYHEKLFETVDPSHVPDFLGGSCSCSGGCLLLDKGPWAQPEIREILQEVFWKKKNSSGGSSETKTWEHCPDEKNSAEHANGNSNAEKARCILSELENWILENNRILRTLLSKQEDIASQIKQLKQLTLLVEDRKMN